MNNVKNIIEKLSGEQCPINLINNLKELLKKFIIDEYESMDGHPLYDENYDGHDRDEIYKSVLDLLKTNDVHYQRVIDSLEIWFEGLGARQDSWGYFPKLK